MSEGQSVYSNIAKGGQNKIVSNAPFLNRQIKLHETERREDWAFFTVFIFILLDFVFFAILKTRLPWVFVIMQIAVLARLICKKGIVKTWKIIDALLDRIIESRETKLNKIPNSNIEVSDNADDDRDIQDDLQKTLDSIKMARSQDWFVFIVLNFIFLDVVFFSVLNNWAGALSLLILEVLILFALAEKMGMKTVCELISAILGRASDKIKS